MAERQFERSYTVEEANDSLEEVVPLLEQLREAHGVMEKLHDDVMSSVPTNGGGQAHRQFREATEAADRSLSRMKELSIIVRDPATGLIDFPAERDGEEIFLCFRLGEERVAWWHPLDSGFAGRRPL